MGTEWVLLTNKSITIFLYAVNTQKEEETRFVFVLFTIIFYAKNLYNKNHSKTKAICSFA